MIIPVAGSDTTANTAVSNVQRHDWRIVPRSSYWYSDVTTSHGYADNAFQQINDHKLQPGHMAVAVIVDAGTLGGPNESHPHLAKELADHLMSIAQDWLNRKAL